MIANVFCQVRKWPSLQQQWLSKLMPANWCNDTSNSVTRDRMLLRFEREHASIGFCSSRLPWRKPNFLLYFSAVGYPALQVEKRAHTHTLAFVDILRQKPVSIVHHVFPVLAAHATLLNNTKQLQNYNTNSEEFIKLSTLATHYIYSKLNSKCQRQVMCWYQTTVFLSQSLIPSICWGAHIAMLISAENLAILGGLQHLLCRQPGAITRQRKHQHKDHYH